MQKCIHLKVTDLMELLITGEVKRETAWLFGAKMDGRLSEEEEESLDKQRLIHNL
jgi:hypothetical protein